MVKEALFKGEVSVEELQCLLSRFYRLAAQIPELELIHPYSEVVSAYKEKIDDYLEDFLRQGNLEFKTRSGIPYVP